MIRSDLLLERISELWVSDELSDKDIESSDPTGTLRDFCTSLCVAILQHVEYLPGCSSGKVKAAVNVVLGSASSERDSRKCQLDRALLSLDKALDPASSAKARMDVLERLTAAVQALRLQSISAKSSSTRKKSVYLQGHSEDGQTSALPDAVEVSHQLCNIARLLDMEVCSEIAGPILSAAIERLQGMLQALPDSFFSPLLPQGSLSTDQMTSISELDTDLRQEYTIRRQMLIERAKVLVQSFMRADRLRDEGLAQEANSLVDNCAISMKAEPEVSLSDIFTARQADLVAMSSKAISGDKFVASVKQLNIGAVPNRGGIPSDRLSRHGHGQPGSNAPGRDFYKKCRLK